MRVHRLSVTEALSSLRSTGDGLSSAEAARRLGEFGPNRLEKVAQESLVLRLLKEFFGFFSVILWIAAALAFLGETFDRGQGMAHVGFAIVVVILVSGGFSFWQDYRVDRALAALKKLLPQEVQALRDGAVARVVAERLVPGDVILLEVWLFMVPFAVAMVLLEELRKWWVRSRIRGSGSPSSFRA